MKRILNSRKTLQLIYSLVSLQGVIDMHSAENTLAFHLLREKVCSEPDPVAERPQHVPK